MKLLCWVILFCLISCSSHLSQNDFLNQKEFPSNKKIPEIFKEIPIILNKDTIHLDSPLVFAYNHVFANKKQFEKNCFGDAKIFVHIINHQKGSNYSLPLIIFPFWPLVPVHETWSYQLDAKIFCDSILIKQMNFIEEENIKTNLWGNLRQDLLQQKIQMIQKKLLARFVYQLNFEESNHFEYQRDY